MTTPTTPTDAMVEAMRTALRQNAQHRLLNQLLADCDLRDMITAALQHQEPGGTPARVFDEETKEWRLPRPNEFATPPEPSALDRAVEEAHTAGFNEAKGRAVAECRAYEKRMGEAGDRRAKAGKPNIVAGSKESAADDLATALQAMNESGH